MASPADDVSFLLSVLVFDNDDEPLRLLRALLVRESGKNRPFIGSSIALGVVALWCCGLDFRILRSTRRSRSSSSPESVGSDDGPASSVGNKAAGVVPIAGISAIALSPDGSDCGFRGRMVVFCDADDEDVTGSGGDEVPLDPDRDRESVECRGGGEVRRIPLPIVALVVVVIVTAAATAAVVADLDLESGGRLDSVFAAKGNEVDDGTPRRDDHGGVLFDAEELLGPFGRCGGRRVCSSASPKSFIFSSSSSSLSLRMQSAASNTVVVVEGEARRVPLAVVADDPNAAQDCSMSTWPSLEMVVAVVVDAVPWVDPEDEEEAVEDDEADVASWVWGIPSRADG
jgi:hypothetical protein